ncbi:prostaglandin E2 receptor EP2 subtype isoform X1 [Neodiprion pinetum]|uniref:prostaglandin E2 receptor EP2 subtype isoform X1 n=1 Tax=Neodiprion pinetum TaxID=441929 RepID=UPI001EE02BA2|nr:prostaglandin E2 receptor EP2 subtype isoform X1 [Neodiprion pinetum]
MDEDFVEEISNASFVVEAEKLDDPLNITMMIIKPKRHVNFLAQTILTLVYIAGVVGNISALVILFSRDKRRNRKHLLMLRCLATNNLVALLGMLVQMHLTLYVEDAETRIFCALRVVWRFFGLFSGCVAIVMAVERWLALTRPFVYQKQVTYPVIVRCIILLWFVSGILCFMPFAGFGDYYQQGSAPDYKNGKCLRYRDAKNVEDIAYAYVFFFFGTVLCLSIVWCNLAVSRALCRLSRRSAVIRRVSRASSRAKPLLSIATGPPSEVVATAEERAFSRLMAMLSITFVICWMPQMISIPLAQYSPSIGQERVIVGKFIFAFNMIADILLCIHFTLDPYIYVLLRMRPSFPFLKPLCRICRSGRSRASSFTGTIDNRGSSGDPPTPITEAPSTPVSEEMEPQLTAAAV